MTAPVKMKGGGRIDLGVEERLLQRDDALIAEEQEEVLERLAQEEAFHCVDSAAPDVVDLRAQTDW